jgi:hypothetical protein
MPEYEESQKTVTALKPGDEIYVNALGGWEVIKSIGYDIRLESGRKPPMAYSSAAIFRSRTVAPTKYVVGDRVVRLKDTGIGDKGQEGVLVSKLKGYEGWWRVLYTSGSGKGRTLEWSEEFFELAEPAPAVDDGTTPLKVGDRVYVPGSLSHKHEGHGTVATIGSGSGRYKVQVDMDDGWTAVPFQRSEVRLVGPEQGERQ